MAEKTQKPVLYYDLKIERREVLRDVFGPDEIKTAQDAYETFAYLQNMDREHFVIAMLDTRHRLIGMHTAAIGSLDMAVHAAREIFGALILGKAFHWYCAHNHPSGFAEPSRSDTQTTLRLAAIGYVMGIPLIDHIIVGEGGAYFSYASEMPKALDPIIAINGVTFNGGRKGQSQRRRR